MSVIQCSGFYTGFRLSMHGCHFIDRHFIDRVGPVVDLRQLGRGLNPLAFYREGIFVYQLLELVIKTNSFPDRLVRQW